MSKTLEKYDKLIVFFLVITASVLAIGWWFAEEKSSPEYSSKIDKLMFDKDNKSPKWVLTLPDKLEARYKTKLNDVEIDVFEEIVVSEDKNKEEEVFSVTNLLINIPNIFNLHTKKQTSELKNISVHYSLVDKLPNEIIVPKIAKDGSKPWIEYGNPVTVQPNFKKIALVISGLGFDTKTSDRVYKIFESEVSFSFSPYTQDKKSNILSARELGHETYADLLLPSKDYLKEDTGPMSLTLDMKPDDASKKLLTLLDTKAPLGGIVIKDGLINENNKIVVQTILRSLKNRGLLVVDATSSNIIDNIKIENLPRQKADVVIDRDMNKDDVDNMLKKAETIAFNKGQVLVVADPKPVILVELYKWIETFSPQVSYEEAKNINLTKPFALVPVSNIVVE